jgi:hypothetical protein
MQISEKSSIRLGLLIAIFGGVASTFIWVGVIQAKVERVENDQTKIEVKIDLIKEDTDYIRGKLHLLERNNAANK